MFIHQTVLKRSFNFYKILENDFTHKEGIEKVKGFEKQGKENEPFNIIILIVMNKQPTNLN